MNFAAAFLLSVSFAIAGVAGAAESTCTRPKAPGPFPDGNTAGRDEMVAAFRQVSTYNEAMTKYLECITAEYNVAFQEKVEARRKLTSAAHRDYNERALLRMERDYHERHDSAFDEQLEVAEKFNKEKDVFDQRMTSDETSTEGGAGS